MDGKEICFVEVGPRDGLQNEKVILSLKDKVELVKRLALSGLKRIEVGSFVSAKVIPQMADTEELVTQIKQLQQKERIPKDVRFSALVPNLKGLDRALSCNLKEIAVFAASTDSFSKKNLNVSVKDSFSTYKKVCRKALNEGLKIRGYLSVAFACPYEGKVSPVQVATLANRMQDMGVFEIALGDTIAAARPFEVERLLENLFKKIPQKKISLHFHNIHGLALSNIYAGYQMGVKTFDGSIGGLGGCPYAGLPAGNVPTESLVYLFRGKQSPLMEELVKTAHWLEKKLKKSLPSPLIRSFDFLK